MNRALVIVPILLVLTACGSSKPKTQTGPNRAAALSSDAKGSGGERCDATKPDREDSEYDSSGDGHPDVRKVYLSTGAGVDARLVMICRETDVNGDGKKDVVRYYDDEGRSLREEADRNFDGRMDMALIFQDGKVVREELDENRDGKIDTKVFLENGKPLRAERDLTGRSTDSNWQPDRWEYYEDGKMVRMGTDLDGDKRVDRWDRDLEYKSAKDAQEAAAAAAGETAAGPTEAEGGTEGEAAPTPPPPSAPSAAEKKKK
jgi:hypothetical protein